MQALWGTRPAALKAGEARPTSLVAARSENAARDSHFAVPEECFPRFLAFYTLVLTGLYAIIPYKTPWCMLSFLDGMILLAGVGAWAILLGFPGER